MDAEANMLQLFCTMEAVIWVSAQVLKVSACMEFVLHKKLTKYWLNSRAEIRQTGLSCQF